MGGEEGGEGKRGKRGRGENGADWGKICKRGVVLQVFGEDYYAVSVMWGEAKWDGDFIVQLVTHVQHGEPVLHRTPPRPGASALLQHPVIHRTPPPGAETPPDVDNGPGFRKAFW